MRCSPLRAVPFAALVMLLPDASHAQAASDPRYLRAFGALYQTSQLGGLIKSWCDARAPQTRVTTDSALAAWKTMHQLDDIDRRADSVLGIQVATIRSNVEARRESAFRALDKASKEPDADCRQMLAYLNREANPQRVNAAEYRLVASRRSATPPTPPSTPATVAATPPAPGTRDTAVPPRSNVPSVTSRGTVHTVAQLTALAQRDARTATARLRQLGRLTVTGTLEVYDTTRANQTVWLNTSSDGWRSRMSVLCYDFSFRRLYDANRRTVTVRGTVREVNSWIQLQDCEIVTDVAALVPSPLSDSGGSRRIAVEPEQVRTAPNAGVTMAQMDGIYQPSQLRYNPLSMLFEPDETTYLVLKDGWLHDNLSVSPHDLNVAVSRRLEPQHWHRWRRQGGQLEIQTYDEYGRTDGRWTKLDLQSRPPIGARRLDGVFSATSSATAGLVGGGGATSVGTTSYTFRPDGTFAWVNFTRAFASSSSGTGPGGSSIVVGGATVGPGGTSVSSVGGGDDAGTYTTDGYTLELRTRRGQVLRFPAFSWDTGKYRDFLVINGTTYSPPKSR